MIRKRKKYKASVRPGSCPQQLQNILMMGAEHNTLFQFIFFIEWNITAYIYVLAAGLK